MWTWAIVTILAGPVLIIASFMDALAGFGGPGTLPWAEPDRAVSRPRSA